MTDSVSEELVERVARVIDPDLWHDRAQTLLAWKVDTFGDAPFPYSGQQQIDLSLARARAALAALPDISSLQGEVDRLREALMTAARDLDATRHDLDRFSPDAFADRLANISDDLERAASHQPNQEPAAS